MTDPRSRIPSVDALLAEPRLRALVDRFGRARTVEAIRSAVADVRDGLADGAERAKDQLDPADPATYATLARAVLERSERAGLRAVINATGVVLHTNLGRAPLAPEALDAMRAAGSGYTNLEYDLEEGRRGSRYVHCVPLLTERIGAEDALVVNNAAAALVLVLNTLAQGRGVVVSRGELVEIGGGFRIPEMLERAGARLFEVGSTNRTRVADYAAAFDEAAAEGTETAIGAILKVHRSNFRITGFTEEATLEGLSGLARERGVPLVHDLGSGLMLPADSVGLPEEPLARASLAAGADVVAVSGDKLLGGPQAGILAGRADLVERMRRNPLCRALRVDKGTLAALEATLRLYRDPDTVRSRLPALAMLAAAPEALEARARALAERLSTAGVACDAVPTAGAVGGGTYPGVQLASWAVELSDPGGAEALARALRDGDPPVVGRIVEEAVRLDVRTVHPDEETALVRVVTACASGGDEAS